MSYKNLLSLLCILSILSCEKPLDNQSFQQYESIKYSEEDIHENSSLFYHLNGTSNEFSPPGLPNDSDLLQSLKWASFVTSHILYIDNELKEEIAGFVDPATKSIPLVDLLGTKPLSANFKSEFILKFQSYMDACNNPLQNIGNGCPNGGNSPGPPICPTCSNPESGNNALLFVEYLVQDNCLELYFPRNIITEPEYDYITSLSHPLNNTYVNEGEKRMGGGLNVTKVFVNPNYVQINNHTIIVARPQNDSENTSCSYNQEYGVPDFTAFLDGNW